MLNLLIRIKPRVSALGRPLWKRLPALDRADPLIPRHRRGEWLRHGGDVCGLLCWWWTVLSVLFLSKESYGKGDFYSRQNLIAVKLLIQKLCINYYICINLKLNLIWAPPPATMVAKTASIFVGGGPQYTSTPLLRRHGDSQTIICK